MSKSKHFEPLFNLQISRAVGRWGNPLGITQSFLPQQIVHLTYEKEPDESGQDLFVKTKWYKDDVLFDETVLRVGSHAKYIYTGKKYETPSRGMVEVSLCSDETGANERQIAQVPFTILEEKPLPDRDLIFNVQTSRSWRHEGSSPEITQSFFPQQRICLTYEKERDESGQDFFCQNNLVQR